VVTGAAQRRLKQTAVIRLKEARAAPRNLPFYRSRNHMNVDGAKGSFDTGWPPAGEFKWKFQNLSGRGLGQSSSPSQDL
jgi:hypothetical protein